MDRPGLRNNPHFIAAKVQGLAPFVVLSPEREHLFFQRAHLPDYPHRHQPMGRHHALETKKIPVLSCSRKTFGKLAILVYVAVCHLHRGKHPVFRACLGCGHEFFHRSLLQPGILIEKIHVFVPLVQGVLDTLIIRNGKS